MTSLKTQTSKPEHDRDALRDLPPEARMRAMHKKLPRSWRGPLIGVGITIAVHLVIVGVVWVRSSEIQAPVTVFFPLMFPLPEQKPAGAGRRRAVDRLGRRPELFRDLGRAVAGNRQA